MLYQADFQYSYTNFQKLGSDPAVKLHGILMKNIPSELAESLHQPQCQPLAIYCRPTEPNCFLARVSVLTDKTAPLLNTLKQLKKLNFRGADDTVTLCGYEEKKPIDICRLPNPLNKNVLTLNFLTPAAILKNGKPTTPLSIEAYFMSVLRKLQEFEQITIHQDTFQEAFLACSDLEYQLQTVTHEISGYTGHGIVGRVTLRLPQMQMQAEILKTVFSYAGYCGVGAKTTQGMGGFLVTSF